MMNKLPASRGLERSIKCVDFISNKIDQTTPTYDDKRDCF